MAFAARTVYILSLAVCLGTLSLHCVAQPNTEPAKGKSPNFVIFFVDDMGYYDVGANGSTFYETPRIDQLAAEGVRFTNAYAACPVCSPSRVALLTGKYPARLGTTDYFRVNGKQQVKRGQRLVPAPTKHYLDPAEVTIAEELKEHGYKTFMAGKWHLGGGEEYSPERQGFDINIAGTGAGHPKSYTSPYQNPKLKDGPPGEYLTDRISSETAKFIQDNKDQPFFVYLPFYNVHTPLQARPDLLNKYEKKRQSLGLDDRFSSEGQVSVRMNQSLPVFAAMVESVDQGVGTVLDALKGAGVDENTIVMFTSDNGGLSTGHTMPTSNQPLRAGKGWMYEGGIREPLIIKWPDITKAGSVSEAVVTGTDFYPTMLQMADLPLKPEQHLDGVSFVDVLKNGSTTATKRDIYWHYPHYGNQGGSPASAIRSGDWKLIRWYEEDRTELFNLEADPREKDDLAQAQPEKAKELSDKLKMWLKSVDTKFPTPNQSQQKHKKGGHKWPPFTL